MIPEIGQVLLIGGLIISVVLGVFPLIGAANGNSQLMRVAGNAALAQERWDDFVRKIHEEPSGESGPAE